MDTPKRLIEFFKLFTKPREVIDVTQLPVRKSIRYITRNILLLEQERKWYLEHDEDDLDYLYYLDGQTINTGKRSGWTNLARLFRKAQAMQKTGLTAVCDST